MIAKGRCMILKNYPGERNESELHYCRLIPLGGKGEARTYGGDCWCHVRSPLFGWWWIALESVWECFWQWEMLNSRRRWPTRTASRNIMSHCGRRFHMVSIPGRDVHRIPQFATLNMLYTIIAMIRSWRKLFKCHHAKVFKNYVVSLRRGWHTEQRMVYVRPWGFVSSLEEYIIGCNFRAE